MACLLLYFILFQITLITWAEYLCDFLESVDTPDLCIDVGTIRRGHYGLLDPNVKLKILRELVNHITETSIFKGEIDELVEQRHALGAARREEALAEARQKREEKERSKTGEEANGVLDNNRLEIKKNSSQVPESSENSEKKESTAGGSKMENGFVSSGNFEKSEKRYGLSYLLISRTFGFQITWELIVLMVVIGLWGMSI